jgi:hypothetical protein
MIFDWYAILGEFGVRAVVQAEHERLGGSLTAQQARAVLDRACWRRLWTGGAWKGRVA